MKCSFVIMGGNLFCVTTIAILILRLTSVSTWKINRFENKILCLFHNESYRTLSRRQANVHSDIANILGSKKGIEDPRLAALQIGPIRDENYRPSYGYEPYWEDGDWVFDHVPEATGTTMCGRKCSPLYIEYGPVCGRNKHYKHKSFDTYCHLKNEDCDGKEAWLIAYRGNCLPELKTFPTKSLHRNSIAMAHITAYYKRHST